jgi:hypothetical protein
MVADARMVHDLREETRKKIDDLLDQFSRGKINREQFQAVYAHYNSKLESAELALEQNDPSLISSQPGQTFDILQAHMAKALGIMIYHNRSGLFVDTLGDFDIPPARIAPALNDFTEWMECNRQIDPLIERMGKRSGCCSPLATTPPLLPCFTMTRRLDKAARSRACITISRLPISNNSRQSA